jgi:hypothetical protein
MRRSSVDYSVDQRVQRRSKKAVVKLSYLIGCNKARLVVHWLSLRQARVLFYSRLGRHPMEVFLAERTSNETLDVTSKCWNVRMPGNRLVRHRHPASTVGQSVTAVHGLVRHCPYAANITQNAVQGQETTGRDAMSKGRNILGPHRPRDA